jgi:GTP 3',8-cyclase
MESISYWKIVRVLTTDACNFDCVFCHNEGQQQKTVIQNLSFEKFRIIISALENRPIKEIQFSGGEPFLNPDTIRMIEWADENTNYEIGCATNMSLLNEDLIDRLSKTRITLNIQFPSTSAIKYNKITRSNEAIHINDKLILLKKSMIDFKLNFVWMTEELESLSTMLKYCLDNSFSMKILPYISDKTLRVNNFRSIAIKYLTSQLGEAQLNRGGAMRWQIRNEQDSIIIKYVDSPCFEKDYLKCNEYAELRLMPNLKLQSCLLKASDTNITANDLKSVDFIVNKIDKLWRNFTTC